MCANSYFIFFFCSEAFRTGNPFPPGANPLLLWLPKPSNPFLLGNDGCLRQRPNINLRNTTILKPWRPPRSCVRFTKPAESSHHSQKLRFVVAYLTYYEELFAVAELIANRILKVAFKLYPEQLWDQPAIRSRLILIFQDYFMNPER